MKTIFFYYWKSSKIPKVPSSGLYLDTCGHGTYSVRLLIKICTWLFVEGATGYPPWGDGEEGARCIGGGGCDRGGEGGVGDWGGGGYPEFEPSASRILSAVMIPSARMRTVRATMRLCHRTAGYMESIFYWKFLVR